MTFSEDLKKIGQEIQRQADARVRRVALAALRQIDEGSPVDKGTFAANWVVSFDTIDRSFDPSKKEADRASTITTATAMISSKALCGTTIFFSNSAPYAIMLENGYSPQTPQGIVGPAITKIKNAITSGQL